MVLAASADDRLDRLVETVIVFLAVQPGIIAVVSGALGMAYYWSARSAAPARVEWRRERLAEGINAGIPVGWVLGLLVAAVLAVLRFSGLYES